MKNSMLIIVCVLCLQGAFGQFNYDLDGLSPDRVCIDLGDMNKEEIYRGIMAWETTNMDSPFEALLYRKVEAEKISIVVQWHVAGTTLIKGIKSKAVTLNFQAKVTAYDRGFEFWIRSAVLLEGGKKKHSVLRRNSRFYTNEGCVMLFSGNLGALDTYFNDVLKSLRDNIVNNSIGNK